MLSFSSEARHQKKADSFIDEGWQAGAKFELKGEKERENRERLLSFSFQKDDKIYV